MRKMIRKHTRHCGRIGTRAGFIQVSYFPYTDPKKADRRKRFQETTPRNRLLNDRHARRYLEALALANFGEGDLLVGLSYSNELHPGSMTEAKERFAKFIRRVNYRRKKMGLPNAKYIVVTERSGAGRIHHHVLMDKSLDRDIVEASWKEGWANTKKLQPDAKRGILPVIDYIGKTFRRDETKIQRTRRWDSSRGNLQKPWVSISDNPRRMSRKRLNLLLQMPEDCEATKEFVEADNPGYELIDIRKEYCEETGQWHVFCRMRLKDFSTACGKYVDKPVDKKPGEKCAQKRRGRGSRKRRGAE